MSIEKWRSSCLSVSVLWVLPIGLCRNIPRELWYHGSEYPGPSGRPAIGNHVFPVRDIPVFLFQKEIFQTPANIRRQAII